MNADVSFRNVDAQPSDPVRSWPTEAVEAALERGSLPEWSRIVQEIRRRPWGHIAHVVESVLTYSRPYGVDLLMERAIASARADAIRKAAAVDRAEVAARIRAALERSGLSRAEAASRLGTSTSRLSTYATGRVTPSAAFLVAVERLGGAEVRPAAEP